MHGLPEDVVTAIAKSLNKFMDDNIVLIRFAFYNMVVYYLL